MRVLALDLSSHAGYAELEGDLGQKPRLGKHGVIHLGQVVHAFGKYPWSYQAAAKRQAGEVSNLITNYRPEVVVIEEVNLGKDRYAQKLLENIHARVLDAIADVTGLDGADPVPSAVYLDAGGAGGWRQTLGLVLSKDQKKANAKLARAKREAAESGAKIDKKALGIRGKTTWKHLAIEYVNREYGLTLRVKDNDVADAIALGTAYFLGATPCTGI